ncbi:glycosyltransferase [Chitinophaga sedimenti]|uniref:glycosyltransferase n=1 Tax=Chitinophaga sedimenti TaxID=2033606 RepID=UPI0020066B09|nr:glycosyltransferase [Chitinophaga sedimenti]MCK7558175.1 glycosyltransferase [Chitinophaga sedimenti]
MNALLITLLALAVLYGMLMITYLYGWRRLAIFTPSDHPTPGTTRVSVIIPARDEADNLPPLLEALKRQTYPSHLFEVIVIDDFSEDGTADVVLQFPSPNVKLLRLSDHLNKEQRFNSYKKKR